MSNPMDHKKIAKQIEARKTTISNIESEEQFSKITRGVYSSEPYLPPKEKRNIALAFNQYFPDIDNINGIGIDTKIAEFRDAAKEILEDDKLDTDSLREIIILVNSLIQKLSIKPGSRLHSHLTEISSMLQKKSNDLIIGNNSDNLEDLGLKFRVRETTRIENNIQAVRSRVQEIKLAKSASVETDKTSNILSYKFDIRNYFDKKIVDDLFKKYKIYNEIPNVQKFRNEYNQLKLLFDDFRDQFGPVNNFINSFYKFEKDLNRANQSKSSVSSLEKVQVDDIQKAEYAKRLRTATEYLEMTQQYRSSNQLIVPFESNLETLSDKLRVIVSVLEKYLD